ncbi:hypothetical protein QE411_002935 [Microbacterium arborescens]|nr:hypothetical protein [Microbacterium arborescens]
MTHRASKASDSDSPGARVTPGAPRLASEVGR